MGSYVLDFQQIDQTQVAVVGGKGAHLGELSRIEGIRVPAGFCVTTDAYRRILAEAPAIDDRLDRPSRLDADHRKIQMAVVVQRMVFPQASGILFTADPVTGNRTVASVEASFGLGEALVSGLVNADVYKVRNGELVAQAVATKRLAIHASPAGGTQEQAIEPERQEQPALTDAQVVRPPPLGPGGETHLRPPP